MTDPVERARELIAAEDEPTRLEAVHLLRDQHPDPDAAARQLVKILDDPGSYVPHAARAALQTLGAAAIPAVLEGLADESKAVRVGCVWALAQEQHGDDAGTIVHALTMAAMDDEADVRHGVAGALGRVGPDTPARDQLLARLAQDDTPRVRAEALRSLGLLEERDSDGHDALVKGLEDGRPEVRLAVVDALEDVSPTDELRAAVSRALDEEPADHLRAPLAGLLERWQSA